MGVSHSPQELAGKFKGLGQDLKKHETSALNKAAMASKLSLLAAPGAPKGRMRGVGLNGANVGVRYKIVGQTAIVRWHGPVHLVNNPTKAHDITPKKQGRGKRKGALSYGGHAYARVHHKATRGKHFFEVGKLVARREAPKAFDREMRGVIVDRFR